MPRPVETYRAARRNSFFDQPRPNNEPHKPFERLDGTSWKKPFDPSCIKLRPRLARGWDYSKGNREKFNSVREQYLGAKKQYRRLMRGL